MPGPAIGTLRDGAGQNLDLIQTRAYDGFMTTDPASLLREQGLHVTAQRLAVLRTVTGHPHCTAEVVAERVRSEIGTISRQAVYDALGILADSASSFL